jgi:hypothetical protein
MGTTFSFVRGNASREHESPGRRSRGSLGVVTSDAAQVNRTAGRTPGVVVSDAAYAAITRIVRTGIGSCS